MDSMYSELARVLCVRQAASRCRRRCCWTPAPGSVDPVCRAGGWPHEDVDPVRCAGGWRGRGVAEQSRCPTSWSSLPRSLLHLLSRPAGLQRQRDSSSYRRGSRGAERQQRIERRGAGKGREEQQRIISRRSRGGVKPGALDWSEGRRPVKETWPVRTDAEDADDRGAEPGGGRRPARELWPATTDAGDADDRGAEPGGGRRLARTDLGRADEGGR